MSKGKSLDSDTKALIAIEAIKGEKTIEQIASRYGTSKSQIRKLKRELLERSSHLFSKERELKDELKKIKELNYESIGRQNEQLNSVLEEINKSCRVNRITAWSNFTIAFFALLTVAVYFVLAQSNCRLAEHTQELASGTKEMAKYTEKMAEHNADMARSAQERNNFEKSPTLNVYCLVKSGFNPNINDGKLCFEASDYQKHVDEIQFFVAVKNEWRFIINDKLNIPFKILILNKENEVVETHPPKDSPPFLIADLSINEAPKSIPKIYEVQEIKKELSKVAGQSDYSDKIIEIKLFEGDVKLSSYSYAEINVRFFEYNAFKSSYKIKNE